MKNSKENRGFVMTSVLIAWAIGLAAIFGSGSYIANKSLNKRADSGFNRMNKSNIGKRSHDFITNNNKKLDNIKEDDLLDMEIKSLISMREEEKLARDVYRTLYEKWDLQTFKNISYSENRHSLAVKTLLDRYEISDPVEDDATGKFTIPNMQTLYNDLVEKGNVSLINALEVGATIEDLDIYDLNNWLEKTDNEDIKIVYENLSRGSRNHIRSFIGQLESRDENYTAQYLSQDEIDKILTNDKERGSNSRNSNMRRGNRMNNKKQNSFNKGQKYEKGIGNKMMFNS